MNKIYKVIWSKVKHQYVVVSELAHRDGKKSKGIGHSAVALLAVLALTAGIGFMPVQAQPVESVVVIPGEKEGNNTVQSTDGENIVVVGVENYLSQVTGSNIWIAGSGNTYQVSPANDVIITGHHNTVQGLDGDSKNIALYGNSNTAEWTHLEDVSLLGNNGEFAYLTDVTAIGQNLKITNMSNSFVAGQNLETSSAGSSVIIGINTKEDDKYIAKGTNLTVVGVDNKVYGNNYTNEPNTVVGYNNILGTTAEDNTTDATQGNTVMGTSNFVDGDGHRNVIYGFENKVYGLVEGSDSGSGYNTVIGQNNTIGQEGSSPVDNVVIIGRASLVSKDSGIAIGNFSHVNNMSGVAIGDNTYVNGNTGRSVALGSNSEVNESDLINDDERGDEVNPGVGVISVGSTGQTKAGVFQRRIINVADGRINPTSYDAINGSQLHDFEITDVDFTDGTLTITSKDKYAVENEYFDAEKHQKIFTEEGIASQSWVNEQIEANGGGSWNVTTNGNPDGQEITTINKNNTVDFSGAKYDETNSNIIVSQEQIKEGENITGTNLKFALNDNIVLGEGEHKISLNGAPEGDEAAFSISDKFAVGQDGSVHAKTQGANLRVTNSFDFNNTGATFTSSTNEGASSKTNINGGRIDVRANANNGQTEATTINGGRITVFGAEYDDKTEIDGQTITAGGVKVNLDADRATNDQHTSTITGLTNTKWDPNAPEGTYSAGRAATEEQLQAAVKSIEDTDYDGWKVSANGGTAADVTNGSTVDFSSTTNADGEKNIQIVQNGTNLTFDLNDNIVLGEGDHKISLNGAPEGEEDAFSIGDKFAVGQDGSVHAETQGVNPRITNSFDFDDKGATFTRVDDGTSSTTNINGGRIDVRANANNGQADATTINGGRITVFGTGYDDMTEIFGQTIIAGNIKVNSEDGQNTIIGLTNTEWDPNAPEGTYSAGRAATEEQLKVVSDKVGEVSIEAGKHSTVTGDEENITVIPEEQADGHLNYEVTLHDNLYLGGENDAFVQVFGTAGAIKLGSGDTIISIDGAAGHISGLTNLSWDPMNQDQYKGSSLAATESQLHDAFGYLNTKIDSIDITGDDNITVDKTEGTGSGSGSTGGETTGNGPKFEVGLKDDVTLGTTDENGNVTNSGSLTVKDTSGNTITINQKDETGKGNGLVSGLTNTDWDWGKYEEGKYQTSNAATESQLHGAMEGTVQYDKVKDEDGNVTVDKSHITLNEGGTTITNVAAGKEDMDAVNYSQLKGVQQQVTNNSMAITNIGNKVGELDNRIDEVGAGAAALAALHPLDFDPDDKWDFAAGYGNYRGENAVAIGAFYRPNEDTMFSVGGTVGNGDNMVNAGVSFKLGQGNGVSTSRVAMAKEIKSMRDIVAKQDAQIQKLTAMVNALVGMEAIAPDTTTMFPDVPENHWAYEAVETMAKTGLVKGYPDGEFKGDRTMTRYEFAQIVYNAIQAGAEVDARLVQEFQPELQYFRVDTVAQDKNGNPTIQRVRVNDIPVQQ